jgi:hypothetical protein
MTLMITWYGTFGLAVMMTCVSPAKSGDACFSLSAHDVSVG